MNNKPFFSVVIPVYNKEPHIERSINSVLNQTFQDYELLIINDASTDGSLEEIKKFSDSKIRLLHRYEPGPGGYAARNLGIKEAKAEWVAFLDADDEWSVDHLEKMYQLTNQFTNLHFMSCGWLDNYGDNKRECSYYLENKLSGNHVVDLEQYLKSCIKNAKPVCTSVACVNKLSFLTDQLFPECSGIKRGGDQHAWLKLICDHKVLAWSAHIGAVYHRNSISMVTKSTISTPFLMDEEYYNNIFLNLTDEEQLLVKKYLNRRLKDGWINNMRKLSKDFKIYRYLYWKGDLLFSITITLITLLPRKFLIVASNIKNAIYSKT